MKDRKTTSIYDVAKKAQVGIATVSRVLNNNAFVKDKTRTKILKAIEELDYIPNFFAKNLVKNTSRIIGLIIPDITNPVFAEMAKGISDKAYSENYTVFLCNTDSDVRKETEFVRDLLDKHADGMIFISTEMSKYDGDFKHYLYLHNKKIPLVFINGMIENVDIPYIRIDEELSGYIAAKYMLDKGLRKIAFIGGPSNFIPTREKLLGFRKALKEFNLPINENFVILDNFEISSGYKNTLTLLDMKTKPEGIITASDMLAIETIKAAASKNLKVPENLKVIGFDDISLASEYIPSITTVAQPKYEMGAKALEILIRLIEKKELKEKNFIVKPTLIIRESCC
ncbi:MAG: LacI family transcriptional regulator [Cyanobacteria bacterium]|nr:LacI family transcriptional regulator [Cyanobacteriota bacterium]